MDGGNYLLSPEYIEPSENVLGQLTVTPLPPAPVQPAQPRTCRSPLQLIVLVGIYFIIGGTIILLYQPSNNVPGVRPLTVVPKSWFSF